MSNIPKYMDFLSENSDYKSEREFARLLLDDDNFRSGFKGYLAITYAINSNINKFGPSTKTTNSIFGSLGFSTPAEITIPLEVPKTSFYNSKLFVGFFSGISCIIGTIIVMMNLLTANNNINQSVKHLNNSITLLNNKNLITEKQKSINNSKNNNIKIFKNTIKPLIKISNQKENLNLQQNLNPDISNLSDNHKNTPIMIDYTNLIHFGDIKDIWKNKINSTIPAIAKIKLIEKSIYNLEIEIKHSESWSLNNDSNIPVYTPNFNNTGISLLYKISDNFSLGVDVRQELFYVEYSGTEIDGLTYDFKQKPNLTTVGIDFKYTITDFNFINPIFQINLGVNKIGYLCRGDIGTEFKIHNDISILLALEYSYLNFSHNDNRFGASKFGFNYGIKYNF